MGVVRRQNGSRTRVVEEGDRAQRGNWGSAERTLSDEAVAAADDASGAQSTRGWTGSRSDWTQKTAAPARTAAAARRTGTTEDAIVPHVHLRKFVFFAQKVRKRVASTASTIGTRSQRVVWVALAWGCRRTSGTYLSQASWHRSR